MKNLLLFHTFQVLEKPCTFDPDGSGADHSRQNLIDPLRQKKMAPENICFSGAFCILFSVPIGGLNTNKNSLDCKYQYRRYHHNNHEYYTQYLFYIKKCIFTYLQMHGIIHTIVNLSPLVDEVNTY